jgi:uncharacterized hydrophobic protein (TIGR00271 family)
MLQLRAYAPPEQVDDVRSSLAALTGVRHLVVGGPTTSGLAQLTGEVDADAADAVLEALSRFDLAADDVTLWRAPSVQPLGWRLRRGPVAGDSAVWAEVLGRARESSRPGLAYLLYMCSAGIVAGVGILNGSDILIVGAMALSPDLLPVCATAVGIVERRWRLALRAFATLAAGLLAAIATAAAATILLRATGRIDDALELPQSVLGPSLTSVGPGSVLVALTAGMAGTVAYETGASAAVGVAISVTTIPAAAYLGAAYALGPGQDASGALGVLSTNVACLVVASTITVWVQRRWRRRA